MLNLTTTSMVLRIITDSSATVDVHASYADLDSSDDVTPGGQNTAIASATTTTVVSAPSSGTTRNVRRLNIFNRSSATSVTVTLQVYDGTTAYTIDSRVLGPGAGEALLDDGDMFPNPSGGPLTRPWYGQVAFAQGDGDPGRGLAWVQNGSIVAATPTNIGTSVARCCTFMLPFNLTAAHLYWYGVGSVTSVYTVALYQFSNLAQLAGPYTITTTSGAWGSQVISPTVTFSKDVLYFIAVSVNTTGTTAGIACMGTTVAATTGEINVAPTAYPGSLAIGSTNYQAGSLFQGAVSSGVLPATFPTPAAQAAWTGGMPAFWLDAA